MKKSSLFNWGLGIVPLLGLVLILSVAPFLSRTTYADDITFSLGIGGSSTDDVSYLAQYGNWTDVEPYGSVWVPNVSADWQPFTYGHWLWTDQGWAWVSYEPYGWLVFHYGNWDYRPDIGWFWIEGNEWSTARVEWLNYNGYCAWAPMPPIGVSWDEPWQSGSLHFWVVVRDRDLDRENIGHYEIHRPPVPRGQDRRDVYHRPLGIHEFERLTGHRVEPHALQRGPVQVYMNPRHREGFPSEHYGERPPERRNEPRVEGPQHRGNQPEARQGENRQAENRGGETPRVEGPQHRGNQPEARQGENRPQESPRAESHRGEGHQTEGNAGRYQREENRSEQTPRVENRTEENRGRQLQRMILPKRDQNKVEKYRPQFEHNVMGHRNENNNQRQNQKEQKGRNRK